MNKRKQTCVDVPRRVMRSGRVASLIKYNNSGRTKNNIKLGTSNTAKVDVRDKTRKTNKVRNMIQIEGRENFEALKENDSLQKLIN